VGLQLGAGVAVLSAVWLLLSGLMVAMMMGSVMLGGVMLLIL